MCFCQRPKYFRQFNTCRRTSTWLELEVSSQASLHMCGPIEGFQYYSRGGGIGDVLKGMGFTQTFIKPHYELYNYDVLLYTSGGSPDR